MEFEEPVWLRIPSGERIHIHQWNCQIFIFADEWKSHDHIYVFDVTHEAGQPFYVFDNREAMQMLIDSECFAYTWAPEPSEHDKEMYQRWRESTQSIPENEVQKFLEELEGRINWDELGGE